MYIPCGVAVSRRALSFSVIPVRWPCVGDTCGIASILTLRHRPCKPLRPPVKTITSRQDSDRREDLCLPNECCPPGESHACVESPRRFAAMCMAMILTGHALSSWRVPQGVENERGLYVMLVSNRLSGASSPYHGPHVALLVRMVLTLSPEFHYVSSPNRIRSVASKLRLSKRNPANTGRRLERLPAWRVFAWGNPSFFIGYPRRCSESALLRTNCGLRAVALRPASLLNPRNTFMLIGPSVPSIASW